MCGDEKLLRPVHEQLIWRAGSSLQGFVLEVVRGRKVPGFASRVVEIGDVFECKGKLDARLVKHILACKAKTKGCQFLSVCSDKAAVGGFNLQSSIFVLPDNTAMVAPPQVVGAINHWNTFLNVFAEFTASFVCSRIISRHVGLLFLSFDLT